MVTPYGVVYDNDMVLEQECNGRRLPAYLYDSTLMVLGITPKRGLAEDDSPEYPGSIHLLPAVHLPRRSNEGGAFCYPLH